MKQAKKSKQQIVEELKNTKHCLYVATAANVITILCNVLVIIFAR